MDITHQRCYKIGKQAKHMQQIPKPWASWEGCYYGKSSHLTGRRHIYGKPSHTCELLSYVGRHPHVCEVFPCMGSLPVYGLWPQYIKNHGMHACGPGTCEVMECMRTCILCHCFGAPWKHVGMVAVGEGIVHMLCPTQYMDTRKSTH